MRAGRPTGVATGIVVGAAPPGSRARRAPSTRRRRRRARGCTPDLRRRMVSMECSRIFSVVFTGLVLATAGFCLTLAGWFAPPINEAVRGVRLAGPVLLVIGMLVLGFSCLICAVKQERCCFELVQLYRDRRKQARQHRLEESAARMRVTQNVTAAQRDPVAVDDGPATFEVCDNVGPKFPLPVSRRQFAHDPDAPSVRNCSVFANEDAQLAQLAQLARPLRVGRLDSRAPSGGGGGARSEGASDPDDPQLSCARQVHHRTMYEGIGVRVKQFRAPSQGGGDESEVKRLLDQDASHSPRATPEASPRKYARQHSRRHQEAPSGLGRLAARDPEAASELGGAGWLGRSDPERASPRTELYGHVTERDTDSTTGGASPEGAPVWTPRAPRANKYGKRTREDTAMSYFIQHSNV